MTAIGAVFASGKSSIWFKHKCRSYKLINNPFPAAVHPGSCLSVVIQYFANEKISKGCDLVIHSDDPNEPVRTLEIFAYTIWDCCDCGCKSHKPGCGSCSCCDDDDEDEEERDKH